MNNVAAITCFLNFNEDPNKLDSFVEFKDSIEKQGVPLFVIEITTEGVVPILRRVCDKDRYITGKTILPILIKGNALNVLSSHVPIEYKNIAWLSWGTTVRNENWAEEASALLDECKLVKIGNHAHYEMPMVAGRDFFKAVGLFDHDFCGNSNLVTFLSATNPDLLYDDDDLLDLYEKNNIEIFYKILSYRKDCYNYFNNEVRHVESAIEYGQPNLYSVEESIDLLKHININYNIHYGDLHSLIAVKNIQELNYPSKLLNLLKKV